MTSGTSAASSPSHGGRSDRRGLPDQIVGELLSAVARGDYPPDSRLPPEAELAALTNVSRLTLREAIKVLRDKGVLRVEHGRGTFVNPPAQWSALDAELLASRTALEGGSARLAERVLEARRVVEVGIAGIAAQRRTEEHLDRLSTALDRMRATHDADDVVGFSLADSAFHDGVMQAAANPFLTALFDPIRTLAEEVRITTSYAPENRRAAIRAHSDILEAVRNGDPEAARRAVSDHLDDTQEMIVVSSARED
jgi:DNA-binding FadR family transcriptional regulator